MALDRRKTTIGRTRNKISNKIHCSYCGSDGYIATINGRDACSYCGAGINGEVSVDYEKHVAEALLMNMKAAMVTAKMSQEKLFG